jgi:hypothetical protein
VVLLFAVAWYAAIQVRWFRIDLQVAAMRAGLAFAKAFSPALLIVLRIGTLVGLATMRANPIE